MSDRSEQATMVAGSLVRLAYALGLLLAPEAMSDRRLAATVDGNAYARMTTRAFGGVHANLSLLTLRAAARSHERRAALAMNLGCDLSDVIATLIEWRGGALPRRAALGSTVLNGSGAAMWMVLLRSAEATR